MPRAWRMVRTAGALLVLSCSSPSESGEPDDGGGLKRSEHDAADALATDVSDTGAGDTNRDGMLVGVLDAPACLPPAGMGACDTFPQCGCNVGEKCDVLDLETGRTACSPAGSVAPFQPCSQFETCRAGAACLAGACKPFCETDADCPGTDQTCGDVQVELSGGASTVPGARACTAACDPRDPGDVCGAGLGCLFLEDGGTDCFAAGGGTGSGTCPGGPVDCAPGYQCVSSGGSNDCVPWCRIGGANDCDPMAGERCVALATQPTYMGREYGVCVSG